ncbi:hypothetical protein BRC83_00435 [Halobacteriales archaeon QS_1_68_17]|nr:MAG: hypothetical protein BRC83_00435 [Halobacteriales archaeon QS_1_68_17]
MVVTELDAPSTIVQDENSTVSATVVNPGTQPVTDDVQYRVAGTAVVTESVTVQPGESTTVELEVSPGFLVGNFEHGIYTSSSATFGPVEVVSRTPTETTPGTPTETATPTEGGTGAETPTEGGAGAETPTEGAAGTETTTVG